MFVHVLLSARRCESTRLLFKLGLAQARERSLGDLVWASTGLRRCATEHSDFCWQRKWYIVETTPCRRHSRRMGAKTGSGRTRSVSRRGMLAATTRASLTPMRSCANGPAGTRRTSFKSCGTATTLCLPDTSSPRSRKVWREGTDSDAWCVQNSWPGRRPQRQRQSRRSLCEQRRVNRKRRSLDASAHRSSEDSG